MTDANTSPSLFEDSDEDPTSNDGDQSVLDDSSIGFTQQQRSLIAKGGVLLKADVKGMPKLKEFRYQCHSSAKSGHTKAGNKIRRYIAGGISPTDLIRLRQELKLIAQEIIAHHESWYHSFKDNAGGKTSAMDWLSKVEDAHLELTAEVQIYLDRTGASAPEDPTTQVTSQSLAKDKAELIELSEKMKTLFGEFSAQLKSSGGPRLTKEDVTSSFP